MKNDKTQKEKKLNTNFKKGIIITLSAILILLIGYTYFTRKNMGNILYIVDMKIQMSNIQKEFLI